MNIVERVAAIKKSAGRMTNADIIAMAQESVANETDDGIVLPNYSLDQVEEIGLNRAAGLSKWQRDVFALAFREAWSTRWRLIQAKRAQIVTTPMHIPKMFRVIKCH